MLSAQMALLAGNTTTKPAVDHPHLRQNTRQRQPPASRALQDHQRTANDKYIPTSHSRHAFFLEA
jgi:hypothetical protein